MAEQEKQRIEFFKTHDEEPTYHSDDINELISNNYDNNWINANFEICYLFKHNIIFSF